MSQSLTIQQGNLLDIAEGTIVHQVNRRGAMGAGLAKQIRNKYPEVYKKYQLAIQKNQLKLGDAQFVQVGECLWVCNAVGQDNYGRAKGVCYTEYDAIASCLKRISSWQLSTRLPAYFPYGMGAGLAGGDWGKIEGMIAENLPDAVIVKL